MSETSNNAGGFGLTVLIFLCLLLIGGSVLSASGQITTSGMTSPYLSSSNSFAPSTSQNYLKNSAAFRQEIVRMEINVVRGTRSLPITQVPRVQKDDVIKMKLLDEAVGGIRPSESLYDWTFLVAFVNPNRRVADGDGMDKKSAVSQEVRFKKTGWYKQYSFAVPYDSQPVFFLYPKPNYRSKILKVVSRNYNEVRKLGDKTIEIAGAYAQISGFLNELQYTLYQTQMSRYYVNPASGSINGGYGAAYIPYTASSGAGYNPYNPSGAYNPSNPAIPSAQAKPEIPFNYNYLIEQSIERTARSFNIQLPSCWGTGSSGYGGSSYGSSYGTGSYGSSYGSTYGSPYGSGYGSSYGSTGGYGTNNGNNFGYAVSQELFSRAQCVAKNIRLEDFDLSVASMLQQGGILAAAYLRDKFPQLAYWINLAAVAIDFIVKVFQKAALRIVPTIVQASDGGGVNGSGSYQTSYAAQSGYANNPGSNSAPSYPPGAPGSFSPTNPTTYTPTAPASAAAPTPTVKLALYAESQPDNSQFVTAYPIVVHKWQQESDPEVISIPPPVLAEPCLHAGINILKNTMIGDEPEADTFTKDFRLMMSAANGFKKEFLLKKNIGLGGWELNLTKEDLASFPKIQMTLESVISGTRGFNEIKSPAFVLPLSLGGSYELKQDSQKAFAVGGKRIVTITNPLGGCQCLQAVIYKPSFGGQFVFEANVKDRNNQLQYSPDGREVSFEIDASTFQPGAGQLILFTYGGEQATLNLKLHALPPNISDVKMARGDDQAIISGERLEQLAYVKINGRRATVVGNIAQSPGGVPAPTGYPNPNGSYPNSSPPNTSSPNQSGYPNSSQSGYPNSSSTGSPNSSQPGYPNQSPAGLPNPNSPNQSPAPAAQGGYPNGSPAPGIQNQPPNAQTGYPNQSPSPLTSVPNAVPALPAINAATNPLGANERLAVFDDPNLKLTESVIQLELGLEDDRSFQITKTFPAAPSRPAFVAGREREIEAQPVDETKTAAAQSLSLTAYRSLMLPVETSRFSASVRNALTDYDFNVENLAIETRLEKSPAAGGGANNPVYGGSYGGTFGGSAGSYETEQIRATVEVLDWKNLRIDFALSEQAQKLLGGRRIQFRLRDRERGASDWYTVKQTFVRIPQIESVVCTNDLNGQCEMKGIGIDYIAQVSTDGGATWYPGRGNTLPAGSIAGGKTTALIPGYANRKMLLVKLRDYPALSGIQIIDYTFTNLVKPGRKPAAPAPTKPAATADPNLPASGTSFISRPAATIPGRLSNQAAAQLPVDKKSKGKRKSFRVTGNKARWREDGIKQPKL